MPKLTADNINAIRKVYLEDCGCEHITVIEPSDDFIWTEFIDTGALWNHSNWFAFRADGKLIQIHECLEEEFHDVEACVDLPAEDVDAYAVWDSIDAFIEEMKKNAALFDAA